MKSTTSRTCLKVFRIATDRCRRLLHRVVSTYDNQARADADRSDDDQPDPVANLAYPEGLTNLQQMISTAAGFDWMTAKTTEGMIEGGKNLNRSVLDACRGMMSDGARVLRYSAFVFRALHWRMHRGAVCRVTVSEWS